MTDLKNRWEAFTIYTAAIPPSIGQIIELLENVESQGYDPKFLQITRDGVQVFGRQKPHLFNNDNGVIHTELLSSESEPEKALIEVSQ